MTNKIKTSDNINRKILISKKEINERVKDLGKEISNDYINMDPIFIGILKGSFIFLADLARELNVGLKPEFDFMTVSSYSGQKSSGKPNITNDIKTVITDRNVIIVEDIVDNGYCVTTVLENLKIKKPASIKICSLLSKPSHRKVEVHVDYVGFEIEGKWVEGYGLDTDQQFRNLPDIWYRT
jgi:hypoxanthine phosphoribosyltransferase